jgi:hypothetical protein
VNLCSQQRKGFYYSQRDVKKLGLPMPPATYDEPKTSVEVVGAHALKMGWMEKAEEESFMKGWHKRFVVLTG